MRVRVSGCVLVLLLLGGLPVAADAFGITDLWSCTTLSKDSWAILSQEAERAHMVLAGHYGGYDHLLDPSHQEAAELEGWA